jgi:tRNA uridine 5-carboxymethylaminomethyl modification enzyme
LYKAAFAAWSKPAQPWLFRQMVDDLMVESRVVGAIDAGRHQVPFAHRGALTAGTFLDGKIHVGLSSYAAIAGDRQPCRSAAG